VALTATTPLLPPLTYCATRENCAGDMVQSIASHADTLVTLAAPVPVLEILR